MMRHTKNNLARFSAAALASVAVAGVWMTHAVAQSAPSAGPFTDAQAQAGQAAYAQNCAKCHEAGEAPPLSGPVFLNVWASRTTKDLYARVKDTMPVDNPGSLDSSTAVTIVAYLLKNNGVAAGAQAFTPTTAVA